VTDWLLLLLLLMALCRITRMLARLGLHYQVAIFGDIWILMRYDNAIATE